MAAGDVDGAARLMGQLTVPAYRQGRVTTIQRWLGWLEDHGGIGGHPMAAVLASLFSAPMGRPVEAERWADAVDRWQYGDPARPDDPSVEAWAALLRALLCRRGVERMRADADEAVRRFAAESFVTPTPALQQGIARVLCGDLDGGEVSLEDAVSVGEQIGSPEHVAVGLCEQSLLAMARSQWDRAEVLAERAGTVLRRAGIEESYATPLVSAVRARTALHRADLPAVHQELARAQRLRHLLTYALPHFAVQARIELARVHLALADLAGARTLMREIDDLLRRRPGLGTLVAEAGALRAQLASQRGSSVPGASALTAAELRLLPLLSTHLSFPEIAAEMFLSRHTIKSEVTVDLPQAGRLLTQPGRRPVPRARPPGGVRAGSSPHQGDGIRSGMRCHGAVTVGESYGSDGEIRVVFMPGTSLLGGSHRSQAVHLHPGPARPCCQVGAAAVGDRLASWHKRHHVHAAAPGRGWCPGFRNARPPSRIMRSTAGLICRS